MKPAYAQTLRDLQRNILAGIITIAPLFVTYLIFSFVLGILAKAGLPIVWLLAAMFPGTWVGEAWLQSLMAVLLTLAVLYVVGRVTSEVVGRQALRIFEASLARLPFVAKIYNSVRKLIDTMMTKDDSVQRVVLVEFPMPGQRSLGFLTRTLIDSSSGQLLAAVLLPNAINPMSGLLQIMPMDRVTETSLTMEQAMSMLMTGGTVGPEEILFTRPAVPAAAITEMVSAAPEAEALFPESELAGAEVAGSRLAGPRLAGAQFTGSQAPASRPAGSGLAESGLAESGFAESRLAGSELAKSELAGSEFAKSGLAKSGPVESQPVELAFSELEVHYPPTNPSLRR